MVNELIKMKSETLIINQVLHGYDNGHTLLRSSIEIGVEAGRTLLIMSDMSGSSMLKGFEEYYTGYPISELNIYALAKTWYAPEMKRPGCVWTHTLLIPFADLARIKNILPLISYFKKPLLNDFQSYDQALTINLEEFNYGYFYNSQIDKTILRKILYSLYQKPEATALVQVSKSKQLEELIFRIWEQQWPRLRRNFGFCSGAINLRTNKRAYLDLQIVPLNFRDDKTNNQVELDIINENSEQLLTAGWIDILERDLFEKSSLRTFFRMYGSDVKGERNSVYPLVALYKMFTETSELTFLECIEKVCTFFPRKNEAFSLKSAIINNKLVANKNGDLYFSEIEILAGLALTEYENSIDYVKIGILERFKTLFINNRPVAYQLMNSLISTESDINSFGKALLSEAALNTLHDEYTYIDKKEKKLLLVFESLNPKFCYQKEFWLKNEKNHRELLASLVKNQENRKIDWSKIIYILIEINSTDDLDFLERSKIKTVNHILNWTNDNQSISLNDKWRNYLRERPTQVISWLVENKHKAQDNLDLIISLLDPNSKTVFTSEVDIWIGILQSIDKNMNHSKKIHAFTLALAFNISGEASYEIFYLSFQNVYDQLKKDYLDTQSWRFLQVHTPPLNFWNEWDKCKKLIKGTVEHFLQNKWSLKKLRTISNEIEIIEKLEKAFNKIK